MGFNYGFNHKYSSSNPSQENKFWNFSLLTCIFMINLRPLRIRYHVLVLEECPKHDALVYIHKQELGGSYLVILSSSSGDYKCCWVIISIWPEHEERALAQIKILHSVLALKMYHIFLSAMQNMRLVALPFDTKLMRSNRLQVWNCLKSDLNRLLINICNPKSLLESIGIVAMIQIRIQISN